MITYWIYFSRKTLRRIYSCVSHNRFQQETMLLVLCTLDFRSTVMLEFRQTALFSFLPLQVEEMKRRQYTLAFTSAGAQAQTYHVSFETLAECQRWHRQASTVRAQKLQHFGVVGTEGKMAFVIRAWSVGRHYTWVLEKVLGCFPAFLISQVLTTTETFFQHFLGLCLFNNVDQQFCIF